MAFFLLHIFPSRLRTFSEAPALFTMYKSEGPISKTREPPRSNAGVAEMMRGEKAVECRRRHYPSAWLPPSHRLLLSPTRARHLTVACPRPPQVIGPSQRDLFLHDRRLLQRYDPLPLQDVESRVCAPAATLAYPYSCHATQRALCRFPNLRAPIPVRPALRTGAFRRTSSR